MVGAADGEEDRGGLREAARRVVERGEQLRRRGPRRGAALSSSVVFLLLERAHLADSTRTRSSALRAAQAISACLIAASTASVPVATNSEKKRGGGGGGGPAAAAAASAPASPRLCVRRAFSLAASFPASTRAEAWACTGTFLATRRASSCSTPSLLWPRIVDPYPPRKSQDSAATPSFPIDRDEAVAACLDVFDVESEEAEEHSQ